MLTKEKMVFKQEPLLIVQVGSFTMDIAVDS